MHHTFDFHVHTHLSDGDPGQSPEVVVAAAAAAGIWHVGLTDHDCMIDRECRRELAKTCQIDVVNGCEVSCYWTRPVTGEKVLIHQGGHWLDPDDEALRQILAHNQSLNFEGYVKEMLFRCQKELGLRPYGQDVDLLYERIKLLTPNSLHRGKRAVVMLLMFSRCVESKEEGYGFLARGGPAYVDPRDFLHFVSLEEAMAAINRTGLSTLNHLYYYHLDQQGNRELLRTVKDLGCQGLEVEYTRYNWFQRAELMGMSREYDLLPNAGSDRHDLSREFIKGAGKHFLALRNRQLELHGTLNE